MKCALGERCAMQLPARMEKQVLRLLCPCTPPLLHTLTHMDISRMQSTSIATNHATSCPAPQTLNQNTWCKCTSLTQHELCAPAPKV